MEEFKEDWEVFRESDCEEPDLEKRLVEDVLPPPPLAWLLLISRREMAPQEAAVAMQLVLLLLLSTGYCSCCDCSIRRDSKNSSWRVA